MGIFSLAALGKGGKTGVDPEGSSFISFVSRKAYGAVLLTIWVIAKGLKSGFKRHFFRCLSIFQ